MSGTEEEDVNIFVFDCLDVFRFFVYRNEDDGFLLIGGVIDVLIVYVSGFIKKDLVYYEVFFIIYRTFIFLKDLINKFFYRERRFRERGCKKVS